jgi:hypothetical protein
MHSLLGTAVLVLLAVCSSIPPASAAEHGEGREIRGAVSGSEEDGQSPSAIPRPSATLTGSWVARADIDGTDASFSFSEYSAGLKWLFLFFTAEQRTYSWHEGSDLGGAGDPWRSLTLLSPGAQYYKEFGRWGTWVRLRAFAGFEKNLSSRSWSYNPQVLGLYKPTQRLTLYAGAGLLHDPVDPLLYPVLGLAWAMGSRTGLSGAAGFPATMIRYGFSEQLGLKLEVQWNIRTYALAGDNTLAPGGHLRTEDIVPGLLLEYSPAPGLTIAPGARFHFGRSLTLYDRSGVEFGSWDVDPSWSFRLHAEYVF